MQKGGWVWWVEERVIEVEGREVSGGDSRGDGLRQRGESVVSKVNGRRGGGNKIQSQD